VKYIFIYDTDISVNKEERKLTVQTQLYLSATISLMMAIYSRNM